LSALLNLTNTVNNLINSGHLCRISALFIMALAPSCLDGGDLVGAATGNVGAGGSTTPFSSTDLDGSWVGVLTPSDSLQPSRGGYLKFNPLGQLTECADTDAFEWYQATANLSATLAENGAFSCSMMASYGEQFAQIFTGTMDASRNVLEGYYELSKDGVRIQDGTFSMPRSSPGFFTPSAYLSGSWVGPAFNDSRKGVTISFELDAAGELLSGEITEGPQLNWESIHSFSLDGSNTSAFTFTDDAVGRMDNVTLHSEDGAVTTFRFLIVSADGMIIGGVGEDTELGAGEMRAVRVY